MTVPYAGDPLLFPATIPLGTGADNNTPANQNTPFEGLADRTQQLFEGKPGDLQVPLNAPVLNDGVAWLFQLVGGPPIAAVTSFFWMQVNIATGGYLGWWAPMPVLNRTTTTYKVTEVQVDLEGDGGTAGAGAHGAVLPATMPRVTLWSRSEQTFQNHGTAIDLSGSAAVYDTPHQITLDAATPGAPVPLPIATFRRRSWMVVIEGEAGAGSVANALAIYSINLKLEQL
jgi:hypothetical protein